MYMHMHINIIYSCVFCIECGQNFCMKIMRGFWLHICDTPCNDSQHNYYMCTCLYGFVFINLAVLVRGRELVCTHIVVATHFGCQSVSLSVSYYWKSLKLHHDPCYLYTCACTYKSNPYLHWFIIISFIFLCFRYVYSYTCFCARVITYHINIMRWLHKEDWVYKWITGNKEVLYVKNIISAI